MNKIKLKIMVCAFLIIICSMTGCSDNLSQDRIDTLHEDIEKIRIEVVNESILKNGISYSLKLINDCDYVIAQNNVYLSFPITNANNNKWSDSGWKVEADGNKLNIEPGQEVLLNVFMSDEFLKYNELICLDRPSVEIKGYLDKVDSMNQFHKGGSLHSFDSDFSSKLEYMKYGESTFEEQHIVFEGENDDWTARLELNIQIKHFMEYGLSKFDTKDSEYFTMEYKKNFSDLWNKNIEYSYETSYGKSRSVVVVEQNEEMHLFDHKSASSSIPWFFEDETIEVVVKVDGVENRFELVKVQ